MKDIRHETILALCEQVREYAELEGTEIGECQLIMIELLQMHSYLEDEFALRLFRELRVVLYNYIDEYIIEEVEETRTTIRKQLVQKD